MTPCPESAMPVVEWIRREVQRPQEMPLPGLKDRYLRWAMAPFLQWGTRSRGGFDVSEVAKALGGGGHKAAAGWTEKR